MDTVDVSLYIFASLISQNSGTQIHILYNLNHTLLSLLKLDELLKKPSMRILLFTCVLFGFLGINFLSANLTSSISVQKDTQEINTIGDVERYGYKLYLLGGSSLENMFSGAKIGTPHKTLWDNQISKDYKYRPLTFQVHMK